MTYETNNIDFLKGGLKSSPRFELVGELEFLAGGLDDLPRPGKPIKAGVLYVARKAGDAVETATEPLRKAYSMMETLKHYFNPKNQND
ncbi:hypothetical protein HOE37_06000 [Candidatus Woesearchaeota archaeon]|jgi:hypothetical protein|nr:hypothetical protein [Candidatus Woesearchaeota archaeon]MBT4336435.1 hypothetical protein [Candidatus Woesearchaeota archaeon]MBT4469848.1 hypothetical protein [Candidatus Woesearchaeota archaeon]MBT6744481.1 hypothetical protein [Candidatus Woesearchaeota archaeon]